MKIANLALPGLVTSLIGLTPGCTASNDPGDCAGAKCDRLDAESGAPLGPGVCQFAGATGRPFEDGCNDNIPGEEFGVGPGHATDPGCYGDDPESCTRFTCVDVAGEAVWFRSLSRQVGPAPDPCRSDQIATTPTVWYDNSGEADAANRQNDLTQSWGRGYSVSDRDPVSGEEAMTISLHEGSFGVKYHYDQDLRNRVLVMTYSADLRGEGDETSSSWLDVSLYEDKGYRGIMAESDADRRAELMAARSLYSVSGPALARHACVELPVSADALGAAADAELREVRIKLGALGMGAASQLRIHDLRIESDDGPGCALEDVEDFAGPATPRVHPTADAGELATVRAIDEDWELWFDNSGDTQNPDEVSRPFWGSGFQVDLAEPGIAGAPGGSQVLALREGSFGIRRSFERDLNGDTIAVRWSADLRAGNAAWIEILGVDDLGSVHSLEAISGTEIAFTNECVEIPIAAGDRAIHELRFKMGTLGALADRRNRLELHEVDIGFVAATGSCP